VFILINDAEPSPQALALSDAPQKHRLIHSFSKPSANSFPTKTSTPNPASSPPFE